MPPSVDDQHRRRACQLYRVCRLHLACWWALWLGVAGVHLEESVAVGPEACSVQNIAATRVATRDANGLLVVSSNARVANAHKVFLAALRWWRVVRVGEGPQQLRLRRVLKIVGSHKAAERLVHLERNVTLLFGRAKLLLGKGNLLRAAGP
eukprot:7389797-Prymnesium_polylepis.3